MDDEDCSTKVCSRCNRPKPLSEFSKRRLRSGTISRYGRCRSCISEEMRDYRRRNRERVDQVNKAWRARNPEKVRRYQNKWNEKNSEKLAAYYREYAKIHRDEAAARSRKSYLANKDKVIERGKKWRAENPEWRRRILREYRKANKDAFALWRRLRRSRIAEAGGSHTLEDIERIRRLQRGRCAYCHRRLGKLQVDHIIPVALRGSNGRRNLQLACGKCNRSKGSKHPLVFARGLGLLL